jgi:hypothetical protein
MKRFIVLLLFAISISVKGISQVIADPSIGTIRVTNLSDVDLNANALPNNTVVKIKVPINNLSANALPSGTCKVQIGLGSKFVLEQPFDPSAVTGDPYFNWIFTTNSGQTQLIGVLIAPLPANYQAIANIRAVANVDGQSTITANFLITNHNTTTPLSDNDPANNNASLLYIVTAGAPLPVTFTSVVVKKVDCSLLLDFGTADEINVSKYELELSKDGVQFFKVSELAARQLSSYQFRYALPSDWQVSRLYARVKSVDIDGRYQYSPVRTINGQCNAGLKVRLYPNPVISSSPVTVQTTEGLFEGRYTLSVYDIKGGLIYRSTLELNRVDRFNYSSQQLAAGQYVIELHKEGEKPIVLRF